MPVQPTPVPVTVITSRSRSYNAGWRVVRVRASAGFYVRSLAHDLGQRLGCGAHLETLRRVRAGAFDEDAAVPLDARRGETGAERDALRIIPIERLLPDVPAVVLNERGAPARVARQRIVAWGSGDGRRPARGAAAARGGLLDAAGHAVGIAECAPAGFCIRSSSWCKILSRLEL